MEDIVFGTGWKQDFSYLPPDVLGGLDLRPDGLYLYRHILHPTAPDLYWVGANVSTLSNTLTHSIQAYWLGKLFLGHHELPEQNEVYREVEMIRQWKETELPFRADRGATVMLHQLHYHDELLRDVGKDVFLKKGCCMKRLWYEIAQPYLPVDYVNIIRQQVAEKKGYYNMAQKMHRPRGHQEGNGWVVFVYGVCCLGAFFSALTAFLMFTVIVTNKFIEHAEGWLLALIIILSIVVFGGVLTLCIVLSVLLRTPRKAVGVSVDKPLNADTDIDRPAAGSC